MVGAVGALATLANYHQSLQLTLAVSAGIVVGAGLLLAFQLKEDRFDVKLPLIKRSPVSGEYFKQLELKYDGTLQICSSSKLSVNTTGFLCPYFGDLSLIPTPANITSNSSTYGVVTQLTQPITCMSSLNVSGYTSFNDNLSCMNKFNVNGALFCNSINSTTTIILRHYLHNNIYIYIYRQNLIPSYDYLVPNRSLNLNTWGNGNYNFNVSGISRMIINNNNTSINMEY